MTKTKRITGNGETLGELREFIERTKELPENTEVFAKLRMNFDMAQIMKMGSPIDTINVEVPNLT